MTVSYADRAAAAANLDWLHSLLQELEDQGVELPMGDYTVAYDAAETARDLLNGEPVYYQPESWRWCRRHNGPIAVGIGAPRMRCMGWFWEEISGGAEDQGRCQVVPLYIEAEDP